MNLTLDNVQNFTVDQTDDAQITITVCLCDEDGRDRIETIELNGFELPDIFVHEQEIEPPVTAITVGDSVRSFDFDSRDISGENSFFIEGIVEAITFKEGCDRYQIRPVSRTWAGVEETITRTAEEFIYPPVNGTPTSMGRITDSVVKI